MPFFIRKKTLDAGKFKGKKRKQADLAEEIPSDEESESETFKKKERSEPVPSEDEEETLQEKKVRLAKAYLEHLKSLEEASGSEDERDIDARISRKLHEEVMEQAGRLHKKVADKYERQFSAEDVTVLKGHKSTVTCARFSQDAQVVFSASKDGAIIKWDTATGRKLHTIPAVIKASRGEGHRSQVLCMDISTDNEFLVTGDQSGRILVWRPATCEKIGELKGHRSAVTSVAIRKGGHELYSGSADRCIKVWGLDEMAYVETVFGHQDKITCIDCLGKEKPVSSGGIDLSIRVWKIAEESQLVFNKTSGAVDCVAYIDDNHFISGSDDNSLSLWMVKKKKPLFTFQNAHKPDTGDSRCTRSEHWISCVAALQNTDLVASGSNDGCVKLWKCGEGFKTLHPLTSIPVAGFINSLQFSSSGSTLVAAVGKEHRLGRWFTEKQAKNTVCVITLTQ